jgi:hypothetical protein
MEIKRKNIYKEKTIEGKTIHKIKRRKASIYEYIAQSCSTSAAVAQNI